MLEQRAPCSGQSLKVVPVIAGLGVDLIVNSRVETELARGEWLAGDGIFTAQEICHCNAGKQPARRYAACFAAKEATFKALGVSPRNLAAFRQAEVKVDAADHCSLVLHEGLLAEAGRLKTRSIHLAIAAAKKQTGAMVILES